MTCRFKKKPATAFQIGAGLSRIDAPAKLMPVDAALRFSPTRQGHAGPGQIRRFSFPVRFSIEFPSAEIRQMNDALIELHEIVKNYGPIRALDHVSLSIRPGITGLLGPNGAGKSTLIKVLLGLLRTSSGSGQILGYQLGSQQRKIRSLIGYMPEDDCFLAGISGVESMQFMARLSCLPAREGLRRSHEILDFCGMEQDRYRLVETYSTGMRQKLRFAQALVHDPPLLILDEPTSGLDPVEREATLNRIRILATQHGKTVILCTHILPDVQAVSQAVIILAQGKVLVSDSLENLNRARVPSLQVKLIGPADPFLKGMQERGKTVQMLDGGVLSISGSTEELASLVWQVAEQTQSTIRLLQPSRTSLEEIFIQSVGGTRGAA